AELAASMRQPVVGAEVVRETLWISVNARATARAFRQTVVRSQVEGLIQEIPIRENVAVAADQPILQIDSTELALDAEQARSALRRAEADYRALVFDLDSIPDPDVREQRRRYARASSGLDGAEVELHQAELQLSRSTVRAPFEGRVADLLVVPGQHVSAGTDLMSVVDLDPIRVEAHVLEADIDLLSEGRRATVTFDAFPEEVFRGTIRSINPVVEEDGSARVTILVSNPGGRIKPGMKADASLDAQSFADRILVPKEAVLEKERDRPVLMVYQEEDGKGVARLRYVRTGRSNDSLVEIVPSEDAEMVQPGEIVLVSGHNYLDDGTPVQLVESLAGASGPGA
ncbi:MAG TPA: efflux RND transporter periplasmic adaptor subunit, partial [Longimicrobiales bacterium]|nr:efflux RND transporter periplasmic adaptor subunit [Longimicrobiales bacterium]